MSAPRGAVPPLWARPDVVGGTGLLALALLAWVAGGELALGTWRQPGPGLFPRGLTLLLGALSAALVIRGLRRPVSEGRPGWADRPGRVRVLLMSGALLGYVAVVGSAGFLLTTAGLFVVMVRWVGGRGWTATLVASVLASGGSYLFFGRLLGVSLPTGAWAP